MDKFSKWRDGSSGKVSKTDSKATDGKDLIVVFESIRAPSNAEPKRRDHSELFKTRSLLVPQVGGSSAPLIITKPPSDEGARMRERAERRRKDANEQMMMARPPPSLPEEPPVQIPIEAPVPPVRPNMVPDRRTAADVNLHERERREPKRNHRPEPEIFRRNRRKTFDEMEGRSHVDGDYRGSKSCSPSRSPSLDAPDGSPRWREERRRSPQYGDAVRRHPQLEDEEPPTRQYENGDRGSPDPTSPTYSDPIEEEDSPSPSPYDADPTSPTYSDPTDEEDGEEVQEEVQQEEVREEVNRRGAYHYEGPQYEKPRAEEEYDSEDSGKSDTSDKYDRERVPRPAGEFQGMQARFVRRTTDAPKRKVVWRESSFKRAKK
ncbi:hypothetical protein CRE_20839 [Caenorhabditis remanei]|uniref:Uncharacterized protein n=1 Tax=Caenorhabditis remanei TaxID=31234 RepID=E3MV28_CAERE|nr:hypothetical protein CRE_20839 [Caenorhabditis remanei]